MWWRMRNLSDIDLDLLRVFNRVARFGNMTVAARSLFVTQPAVSKAVGQLEERLGARLFARSGKRITLTEEGRVLYETTQRMQQALQAGSEKLQHLAGQSEGSVRIAFPFLLLHFYLLPHLAAYRRQFSRYRIELKVENRRTVMREMLLAGKIDFFLDAVHGSLEDGDERVELMPLAVYRNFFAASRRAFGSLEGRAWSLEEINRHPLIVLREGSDSRRFLEERFAQAGLQMNIGFDCDTSAIVEDLTQAGLGLGAMVRSVSAPMHLRSADLFEVRLEKEFEPGHFVLFKRKRQPFSAAAQALVDTIFSR